jgi:hypothetical protein
MRKIFSLCLFILASVLLSPLSAQDPPKKVSANIRINAQVIPTIELITIKGMEVSQTEAGQNVVAINPITSSFAGHMIAIGTPGADIRVSYISLRELNRTDGDGLLVINYEVSGNTEDNQQTSELLGTDNKILTFNEEGQYYIWIGGSVDLEQATPGNYEGEFTLEVEYI